MVREVVVELAEAPVDVPRPTQVVEVQEEVQLPGLLLRAEGHNLPPRAVAAVAQTAALQQQFRRSPHLTPGPNSLGTIRPSSS